MIFVQRKVNASFLLALWGDERISSFRLYKIEESDLLQEKNLIFLTFWFFYVIMEVSRKTM
ncbi:hypothetical protein D8B45_04925 [Candidatus Gracilibacteria bacterium]|nr:MAG: hypothetical protein D8B45_04925 [Candidatus Gracilibacteria bacterium]